MGLRSRIIVVVVLVCSIINLFLCFYFTAQIRGLELDSLNEKIDKAAYMMKLVNARPLYNVDRETLRINMETFFDDENMKSIAIKESDIEIDIRLQREFDPGGEDIVKRFYIAYKGLKLGKMEVVYTTILIERKLARFRNQMLMFTFTVILALALILVLLISRLTAPVTKLALAASEIAAGNLEKEIEQDGIGEIRVLSRNFAVMRDAIKDKINDLALTNKNLEKEIRQKEINEKKILHQSMVISSVNTFFQKSMVAGSYREIARLFIPIAQAVIPGRYCFVGEVSGDERQHIEILSLSDQALADMHALDREIGPQHQGVPVVGVFERVIRENKAIMVNDPDAYPAMAHLPDNHLAVENFMGIPMQMGAEVLGIVGFSGKTGGYDQSDRESAQMLAAALVEALSLKKREDEKLRLEEMMIQSEKMVSLGGLAAGMAHEINNPLAGILQNTQVIQNRLKNKLPANVKAADELGLDLDKTVAYMEKRDIFRMTESVLTAGKRAAGIVANMLSFSRKSASGFLAEDICGLLDRTLELAESDYNLKKKFDFKKIRIEKYYDEHLPKVSCKSSEIQQVFFNILSNGAQAMMSHEMRQAPCFHFKVFRHGPMLCVMISDNGPGMPAKIKKRVFEPFFTTKNVGEGTGLGLAVSYFIITENHKGQIVVNSKPGEGSSFTIKLPI